MIGRLLLAGLALALVGAAAPPFPAPPVPIGSDRFVPLDVRTAGGRIAAGGLVVTNVTARCPGHAADDDPCVAVRIDAPGRAPFVLAGTAGTNARVGIGALARGEGPSVVLETFTGGAHCCQHYAVALPGAGGWRRVVLSRIEGGDQGPRRQTEFDHGLDRFPTDLDGDGRVDFRLGDDAFLYAFTDYADSRVPPVVLDIVDGRAVDVSGRPAFRPVFAADLGSARHDCRTPGAGRSPNGACAAYAADAARLGRFAASWRDVLAHYGREADDPGSGALAICTAAYVHDRCPPGHEVRYRGYPAALRALLVRTGYLPR